MCSTPPASTTSAAPIAISPAPAVTAVSAPAHMRSTAKPGHGLREPGEQRDVAAERQALVADLRGRGEDDVADPLGGSCGFRRSSSRTTLTAMSSARVRQKTPFGPARPNAVRTPSTKYDLAYARPRGEPSWPAWRLDGALAREEERYATARPALPDAAIRTRASGS